MLTYWTSLSILLALLPDSQTTVPDPRSQIMETQVAHLAERYGAPLRVVADLEDGSFSPLTKRDRSGEVCMVLRRKNGHLLTASKQYYPDGIYRLLTGGVSHGELIETALLREVGEETGLSVVIRRFLAVIEYRAHGAPERVFVTFVFLLDEVDGVLMPQDETEQITGFREVLPEELPALAEALERTPETYHPEVEGFWRSWGRFRAITHRVVYEILVAAQ